MAVKLKADKRPDLKKSYTKKIRQAGDIPAIVYGSKKEARAISINSLELLKTVRDEGKNAIISLELDGESVDVMLHDYQIEPLKDELVHADFYIVNMSQEMDVEVVIHLDGEAQGVKDGGVMQQPLHDLAVRAKPRDIPEEIKVDVSKLEIGDSITVADLKEGKNYEILEDEETTIVTILTPDKGTTEEDDEEADEEQAEPELVGEEKSEEEK
ncbi:50S ribosomal protein L25/general stress protein Ctc [Aquibacillus rhizosphaerae]|uniref:Large ribosomal subunit protein bL25 n=1 Tax=Aquibacillus rhizosphaerae TaxID=3051431 RepID=A0ABT7L5K0_9BACI|nr:50S ribosomal protein L25/general stress protein Ctc [Aquibacillus sp. LR5S19]MDL4840472.1 50S ribosomal protein L25/general stress protein Ctc [Aquibacillus sp. LR5S19]